MKIRTSTRNDKHTLGGSGQIPKVREHTFNNLIGMILLLSSAKCGRFNVEAKSEKGEGYLMVKICDVITGFPPSCMARKVRRR